MHTDLNTKTCSASGVVGRAAVARFTVTLILSLLLPVTSLWAQDDVPQLRHDHPQEYIVQPGDTLWDLANKFLIRPWEWPAIWQANPQVENPHLIYPGDVLNLSYLHGRPVLQVVRRAPEIHVIDEEPLSAIPLDALRGHLRWPRLVSDEDMRTLPYLVANEEQNLLGTPGKKAFVRGLDAEAGTQVMIARQRMVYVTKFREGGSRDGQPFTRQYQLPTDPGLVQPPQYRRDLAIWRGVKNIGENERQRIGNELFEVAYATVLRNGDVSVLEIDAARREVKPGDYVLPLEDYAYAEYFYPRAMDEVPDYAEIIGIVDIGPTAAHNDIVILNIGSDEGVGAGHVFAVMNPGEEIADTRRAPKGSFKRIFGSSSKINVQLPDEYVARVMVYRSYANISYALIMDGKRDVHNGDLLANPSSVL